MQHANAGLLTYRSGAHEYPVKTSTRCRTCRSKYRPRVETLLLEGQPYAAIVESLPEDDGLNAAGIGEHYRRGHLAVESEVARRLLDNQAEALGKRVEAEAKQIISVLSFAQAGLRRAFENLLTDDSDLTIMDGIRFANLLMKYDALAFRQERNGLRAELTRTHEGLFTLLGRVRGIVSEEQWSTLGGIVAGDPELRVFWPPPT